MKFPFFNRKKKRENEILDTTTRKKACVRGHWHNVGVALGAVSAIAALGAGGWYGWKWGTRKAFAENPRFAIANIVVENPNGLLSPAQIIKASGTSAGQNLFALNLERVRRDIELISIVERASARRDLPGQLMLCVSERVPVLRLAVYFSTTNGTAKQTTLYLDRTGHVMELPPSTPEVAERFTKLPWLTGLRLSDVRVGKVIEAKQCAHALRLLSEWETAPVSSAFALTQIDVGKPNQIAVVSRNGSVVVMETPNFKPQLARLATILADARAKQQIIQLADLSVAHNIPVTFRKEEKAR